MTKQEVLKAKKQIKKQFLHYQLEVMIGYCVKGEKYSFKENFII